MEKQIEPRLKLICEYFDIKKYGKFVIPEYQRAYSWGIEQCDQLWQDLERFTNSEGKDPYFFGTIIVDCSTTEELNLIDGQQRTTTFLLLLKALLFKLYDILESFKITEETEQLHEALTQCRNKIFELLYLCDAFERVKMQKDFDVVGVSILTNNSVNEVYKKELLTIMEAKNFDEAEKNVEKIKYRQKDNKYTNFFRNFKFFREKLEPYRESKLYNFSSSFLNKCQVIEIRSWQTEQAIMMFNSLNSTGLPLTDADIISAQLYSRATKMTQKTN